MTLLKDILRNGDGFYTYDGVGFYTFIRILSFNGSNNITIVKEYGRSTRETIQKITEEFGECEFLNKKEEDSIYYGRMLIILIKVDYRKKKESRLKKTIQEKRGKMITLEELKRDKEALEEKFRKYEEQEQQKELVKDSYELEFPNWNKYYYCADDGEISFNYNHKDGIDEGCFGIGNFFETEEEAELEVKRRKLMTRFNQFRDKCNGGWKPGFRSTEIKYFIQLLEDMTGNILEVNYATFVDNYCKFGYFKNKKDCQRAIELFGDEIKKVY